MLIMCTHDPSKVPRNCTQPDSRRAHYPFSARVAYKPSSRAQPSLEYTGCKTLEGPTGPADCTASRWVARGSSAGQHAGSAQQQRQGPTCCKDADVIQQAQQSAAS